ncbi:MAG: cation:proton antiporter [Dehalococcoidia bacterium]
MEHAVLELGFAVVLMAVAAALANRFRVSVVPFLILIGLAVGPHLPHWGLLDLRFTNSAELIHFLGRVGVLFLLFYLGLEFSLRRLVSAGRSIAVAGAIYIGINLTLGLAFGWLVGWPIREILVVAGITTISSSAIVAKMLADLRRAARPETGLIVGIIMFEDVFLAVYMSLVSGLILGGTASLQSAALSVGIIAVLLLALFTLGRQLGHHLNRWFNIPSQEIFILFVFAALFMVAGLSETIGVAEAIGALLIGLVLAETDHVHRMEQIVLPFRDFFGAVFFFSFGLSIDPLGLTDAIWLAAAAAALTIAGNFTAGVIVGRIAGLPGQGGANIGLTIVSRGEFSIVMASLARAGDLLAIIQPFTAVYVLILSILGPILTKESNRVYAGITRVRSAATPAAWRTSAEAGPLGGQSDAPGEESTDRRGTP